MTGLLELLAEHDESLLAAYVDDEASVPYARLREVLAAQTAESRVHPVFFGSAITGAGWMRCPTASPSSCRHRTATPMPPVSGTVFKIERGPAGDKVAYVRLFAGTVRTRDLVAVGRGLRGEGHCDQSLRTRRRRATLLVLGRADREGLGSGQQPDRRCGRPGSTGVRARASPRRRSRPSWSREAVPAAALCTPR